MATFKELITDLLEECELSLKSTVLTDEQKEDVKHIMLDTGLNLLESDKLDEFKSMYDELAEKYPSIIYLGISTKEENQLW